ncbi:NTP transferase domain-containing protein [Chloroflexota bacterium]
MRPDNGISVVIPAAGLSTRMGQSKLTLPWRSTTIIGQIIETISSCGLSNIFIVTDKINLVLNDHLDQLAKAFPISRIDKPECEDENMLSSIQVGLKTVKESCDAVLISLADQPQIQADTIEKLISGFAHDKDKIVVPSFNLHRGHPWLLPKSFFDDFLEIKPPLSARNFLIANNSLIRYVAIDNESIFRDIDTPLDYQNSLPSSN